MKFIHPLVLYSHFCHLFSLLHQLHTLIRTHASIGIYLFRSFIPLSGLQQRCMLGRLQCSFGLAACHLGMDVTHGVIARDFVGNLFICLLIYYFF